MVSIASHWQDASGGTVSIPIILPQRIIVRGVSLCVSCTGLIAAVVAHLQVSASGVFQNTSGAPGTSPMYGVLAQITLYCALNLQNAQSLYVPMDTVVRDCLYLHSNVSSGQTVFFTTVIYFE